MRGFQPGKARAAAQNYADGGLVKGPGTGISDEVPDTVPEGTYIMPADSTQAIGHQNLKAMGFKPRDVPVNLSNGEFKLPPEQVHAIGVQALDQIKGATHTPVARGFVPKEPGAYFVNGGPVYEDARRAAVAGAPGVTRQGNSYTQSTVADLARSPGYGAGAGGPVGMPTKPPAVQPQAVAQAPRQANQPTQFSGVQRSGNSYSAAPAQPRQPSPQTPAAATPPVAAKPQTGAASGSWAAPATTSAQVQRQGNSFTAAPAAPKPAAPQTGGASGSWQSKPQAQSLAPSVAPRSDRGMPAPAPERSSMLGEFVRDGASEIAAQANAGNLAGAFGTATRKTLQAPGMTVLAAAAPALNAAGRMWDGLVGNSAAQPAPAVVPAASAKPPAAATTTTPPAAPAATDAAQNPAQKPEHKPVNQQAQAPNPNGKEVLPGVTRQGSSYTNIPGGNASGGSTGQPSAQNMAAADALVARDRGFAPSQPADVMGIYSRASEALKGTADAQRALDDYGPRMSGGVTARDYLTGPASAEKFQQDMLRTNLMSQAQKGGRGAAAAMQALNAMEGNQIAKDTAQMREQGDTARFNAREQGETARAGMRESGENARSGRRDALAAELGRGQLDLQRSAQGFTTRQGERQEKLYAEYEAAKTPEEQNAVARKIAALSGKAADPKDNFMVVGGGQEWDAAAGAMRNVPQRLVDLRTGQDVGATGQGGKPLPAPADPKERKVGTVYVVPNGANVRWTGQGWQQA